jgi:hypothetical protein
MVDWLDESTLGLLLGMMVIVGQLSKTGARPWHTPCRGLHAHLLVVRAPAAGRPRARPCLCPSPLAPAFAPPPQPTPTLSTHPHPPGPPQNPPRPGLFQVLCAATLKACGGRMWLLSVMVLYLTGAPPPAPRLPLHAMACSGADGM